MHRSMEGKKLIVSPITSELVTQGRLQMVQAYPLVICRISLMQA